MMGACMSSNKEDEEQKKHSQAIDRVLDEDSKRLRRECKILLLGEFLLLSFCLDYYVPGVLKYFSRIGREREVNHRQTDEDHTS